MADGADSTGGDYAHLWAWEPLTPADIAEMLHTFQAPWWICGGWAVDLFVGRGTRRHDDLDVAVLRRDQAALHTYLTGWDLRYATEHHTLEPWDGAELGPPVHGIWARRAACPSTPWTCEFLLNESSGDEWIFRRGDRVRRPLAAIGDTRDGIPYLRPEVVLLYKAADRTPKNEVDFAVTARLMPKLAAAWLREALCACHPEHPWIQDLA